MPTKREIEEEEQIKWERDQERKPIKEMKIVFLAKIDPLQSSTRVRILKILDELKETYHQKGTNVRLVQYGDTFNSNNVNIMVIQKWGSPFTINLANELKRHNITIVYDTVDRDPEDIEMLKIADRIIVDCNPIRDWCREQVRKKSLDITVIPDSIDYLEKPIPRKPIEKNNDLKIVYFASPSMLDCIKVCDNALLRLIRQKHFTLTYISGKEKPELFQELNVNGIEINYIHWNQNTFSSYLREFDLAIIPQQIEKGDAKLVTAITHNLPVVASDIEPYRHIGAFTNTDHFLCTTQEQWYDRLVEMFDPKVRTEYLDKTLEWIWRNYNINRIMAQYMKFFNETYDRR